MRSGLFQPATGESGALQTAAYRRVLAHGAPHQITAMIFDHCNDRPLLDPEVVDIDPAQIGGDCQMTTSLSHATQTWRTAIIGTGLRPQELRTTTSVPKV
jgi:hypothetical protein